MKHQSPHVPGLRVRIAAAIVFLSSLAICQPAHAGTIIKLSLGNTGPDIEFSGGLFGVLSTVDDGVVGTPGDQNTSIDFLDFLSGMTDINLAIASYTLDAVTATGAPVPLGGGIVLQNFAGGFYRLFDDTNALLLDVNLSTTLLVGGATGSVFSITNGTVVGGSLAPLVLANSISMSIAMTNINGGAGLSIAAGGLTLNPFVAEASKVIAADAPEPSSFALAGFAVVGLAALRRRRKRGGSCREPR